MRRVLIIVGILLIPVVPIVLVVTGVLKTKPQTAAPVTLTIWGTNDTSKAFTSIIANYKVARPYATISYSQVRSEDYLDHLKSAWAQGTGPDIFFVPSDWVGQMSDYAVAAPAQIGVPIVQKGQGFFKSTTQVVQQNQPSPSATTIQSAYVDAVASDVLRDGQLWGLPLSMDTLVMYYNKDLLNNAKIFEPAKTWGELVSQIDSNHLSVTDNQGTLVQSAVALGTYDNVPYANTLIKLLMMQNGVAEAQPNGSAHLQDSTARAAMDFYLSFANDHKVSYSWNTNQPNALDAFLAGKVVYYFGTLKDRKKIEQSSFKWDVAPMLHLSANGDRDAASGQTRFIDSSQYEVMMVSKASSLLGRSKYAWNLLYYMSRDSNVTSYLNATEQLSALKSILIKQKDNASLGIYANQLLTARSWYHGSGGASVDQYLRSLIQSVNSGQATLDDALRLANEQIKATL